MKTLNVWFEDEEYKLLKTSKGVLSWHDFIIMLAKNYNGDEKKNE